MKEDMRYIVYERRGKKTYPLAYCRTGYMARIIELAHLEQHHHNVALSVYVVRNPDYKEHKFIAA